MRFPPDHPVRSVAAMRLLANVEGPERVRLTHALFRAYWVEGRDISKEDTLAECMRQCNISPQRGNREHGAEALSDATQRAYDDGAFDVPTFFVFDLEHGHDGTMHFGLDRLLFVRAALGDDSRQLFRRTTDPAPRSDLPTVEFFFDLTSPWSFLAFTQLRRISHLCTLRLTPVVVGAVFKAINWSAPSGYMGKNRLAWYQTDLEDFAEWYHEDVHIPSFFPVRPIVPNRLALTHPACTELLFRAIWQRGIDVGDQTAAVGVLNEVGLDGAAIAAKANSAAIKNQLRENTERAVQQGLFGVPSFLVQNVTLLWGVDKLDTLLDLLSGWVPNVDADVQRSRL